MFAKVLMIGDIVGKPGLLALENVLPKLLQKEKIDLVIANGENAADGLGITVEIATDMFTIGVDVITSGNHIFKKREIIKYLDKEPRILRPANYPADKPGHGFITMSLDGYRIAVLNLEGKVFLNNIQSPFLAADEILPKLRSEVEAIFVDFHAEATSEKVALARYLDGRVTAVIGTHTHVQTADEKVLPNGTAYITDVGMTGPIDSVIGVDVEKAIARFLSEDKLKYKIGSGDSQFEAVLITFDTSSGKATDIQPIQVLVPV